MESNIRVDGDSEALREKFRRLQAILINLSARADAARGLAAELEEKINWLASGRPDFARAEKARGPGLNEARWTPIVGTIQFANCVRHLEAIQLAKGSFDFRVDFSPEPIRVPRLPGHLLLFLASGEPEDGIAGWRTKAEIIHYLQSISGKTYRSQFVSQLVYQLRDKLGKFGSRVECNPQRGWRFALKTGGPDHSVRTRLAKGPEGRPRHPVLRRTAESVTGEEVRSLNS
ncbi:MAG: hypothetical protein WA891_18390 [Acidobacteriaceae bacterium]|jgi:hypothetical protein